MKLRSFVIGTLTAGALMSSAMGTLAQGLFGAAATVNETVVTNYEVEQRALFYRTIRRLGDLDRIALEDLVDDRLKQQAARALGVEISPEQLDAGMLEFAQRANLETDAFLEAIAQDGVDANTFRDFVRVGLLWRGVVRARFQGRVQVSDAEIDAALGTSGQSGLRVLLSEVIIPITPQTEDQVRDLANQISALQAERDFEDAARRFSAAATRANDGRLDWMPLSRLPGPLQPVVLELKPGEISAPIELDRAIAVFRMRGIEELPTQSAPIAAVEYGVLRIPGGQSASARARAASIRAQVDTCDDLYGVNYGGPEAALTVQSQQPSEIPRALALELAKLDRHEVSTTLTSEDGSQLLFVMLCGRTAAVNEEAERGDVLAALQNRRLSSYADGYLEQLRADATINLN